MANSHCPRATGHTSSAVFNRRVSFDVTLRWDPTLQPLWVGGRPEKKKHLLFSECSDVCSIMPGMGCVCLRVQCGCVPVHVSKCMLFPWSCGPDMKNATSLQCVSCTSLPLLSFALPSSQLLLSKISSNLTSACWWSPREDVRWQSWWLFFVKYF